MKKLKHYFLALLMVAVFLVTPVNAKEAFKFGWENDNPILIKLFERVVEEDYITETLLNIADNNYEFKDGYVTGRLTLDERKITAADQIYSELTYYDESGKELATLELDGTLVYSIKSYGDYLYAFTHTDYPSKGMAPLLQDEEYAVIKIDENMEIVERIVVNEEILEASTSYNPEEDQYSISADIPLMSIGLKIIGYDNINIVNNKLYLLFSETYIMTADLNLNSVDLIENNNTNLKKYFLDFYTAQQNFEKFAENISDILNQDSKPELIAEELQFSIDSNDKYMVGSGVYLEEGLLENAKDENEYAIYSEYIYEPDPENPDEEPQEDTFTGINSVLELYDLNNKSLWKVSSTEYAVLFNTHIIGDYVVTIGLKLELVTDDNPTPKIYTDILVYDFKGNLVQKISDNSIYLGLFPTSKGFITANIMDLADMLETISQASEIADAGAALEELAKESDLLTTIVDALEKEALPEFDTNSNNKIYNLASDINIKVIGKGNIEVIENSIVGEAVTFTVTPAPGYEISKIIVTDSQGNKIEFTDYTFTMPDSDVLIEVEFITNPNTVDIALTAIALLAIAGGIGYIALSKKLNWLK